MRFIIPGLLLILFAFMPLSMSLAAGAAAVGDDIAPILKAPDQNGDMQSFTTLTGEKGAVLVFVRSVDWCSYCQAQLIDLGERGAEIEALGYNIVAISYDAPEKLAAFVNKYDYPYTLLSDKNSEIIKALGILNDSHPPESQYYGIPHPAVFVVNADGVIQAKLQEEGYKERPPVRDIIEAIKAARP